MDTASSYLRLLPAVLWRNDDGPGDVALGSLLNIVEKVLTGLPDGIPIRHGDHEHQPLSAEVGNLRWLFDPVTARSDFLPWLAGWLGLDFPTLADAALWEEDQQRKVIGEIAGVYRTRGRKTGLNRFLDLYSAGSIRPRVALDDGNRLATVTPAGTDPAPVSAFAAQGPTVRGGVVVLDGLVHPAVLATGPDGSLFVGDRGLAVTDPIPLRNRIWRLDLQGRPDYLGAPPRPTPLAAAGMSLFSVAGLAVRPAQGAEPETLYVLDSSGKLFAVPAPYLTSPATLVTSLSVPATTFAPVGMAVDADGAVLVLDAGDGGGTPNPPKLIAVTVDPLTVTRTPLATVITPLSLFLDVDGTVLIGDGGPQSPAGPTELPGNVRRVDRRTSPWTETDLLPADNPLVAPTGLARTRDGALYVVDVGLKPIVPSAADPFICAVAESAAVWRIEKSPAGATSAVRRTDPGQFVYPAAMIAQADRLVIADPGQPGSSRARLNPFEFDVVIHFTDSRLDPDPGVRRSQLNRAVGNIRTIVDQQKPAHTVWNLVTEIL